MRARAFVFLALVSLGFASRPNTAVAQTRVLQIAYTPTKRAQIAIWIESADGTFLRTIMLTEAVGLRGIGNRPGALQMNSAFRHPYGRREGVLPVWAYRRAAAPGAQLFPRVIFQNRVEGAASRTTEDSSREDYFCLSFNETNNLNVDATSCASVFNSDKGRFLTNADVTNVPGYSEGFEYTIGTSVPRLLSRMSLYPMRRDTMGGGLHSSGTVIDTPDVATYIGVARSVMPDIDAVTRATAAADTPQLITFTFPADWPFGDYVVWFEANTERDFNDTWSEAAHPTPYADGVYWDGWAVTGYAYRGQPSVVYNVPIHLDANGGQWTMSNAVGFGELQGLDGQLRPLDPTITNDPIVSPGSGVDRLRISGGIRASVSTDSVDACMVPPTVPEVSGFSIERFDDPKHSHEWASAHFTAVQVDGEDASNYQVKISLSPITTETEFVQAEDAKAASTEFQGVHLCPVNVATGSTDCPTAGTTVAFDIGKLLFSTHYYVAIRATGPCGTIGPITTAEVETTAINFTTVAPCFVATAAHGSAMAADVQALRAYRNEHLMTTAPGRAFVRAYYAIGPRFAAVIADHAWLRSIARAVLRPFVQASR